MSVLPHLRVLDAFDEPTMSIAGATWDVTATQCALGCGVLATLSLLVGHFASPRGRRLLMVFPFLTLALPVLWLLGVTWATPYADHFLQALVTNSMLLIVGLGLSVVCIRLADGWARAVGRVVCLAHSALIVVFASAFVRLAS
jgi:hypothetical protein